MSWLALLPVAALLWLSARYAWWRPAVDESRPRILMYHMVSEHRPGAKFNGLRVPPAMFARQLAWLRDNGYTFVTMSELVQGGLPPKCVAITFDDGYRDNLLQADPLLARYGAKATVYLVLDRHDRDWSTAKKAHHDSGELAREAKLSDEEVRLLLASGRWELGSHTLTHANLARCDDAQRAREIGDSRRQLEQQFGTTVTSFAYPFGIFGEQDVQAARAAGYTSAVTTLDGIDPHPYAEPLRLSRVKVSGKDNFIAFVLRMRGGKRGWRK